MGSLRPGGGQDRLSVTLQVPNSVTRPEPQQGRATWEGKVQPGWGRDSSGHLARV